MSVDIGADNKGNNVEERNPSLFRQEFLGERQCQGRCNPADFHNGHEASFDRGSDLVEGPSASNHGHRRQIDSILYRR